MTTRATAGAIAATCSIFFLGACGSGGQSTTGHSTSTPLVSASSSTTSSSTASPSTPSSTSMPSASSSSTAPAPAKMSIKDFKYTVPTSVTPGAKITVTNNDGLDHTVTSDKAGVFDAVIPGSGGTHTITAPTKPGTYPFHCIYHSNMHGVLVVS